MRLPAVAGDLLQVAVAGPKSASEAPGDGRGTSRRDTLPLRFRLSEPQRKATFMKGAAPEAELDSKQVEALRQMLSTLRTELALRHSGQLRASTALRSDVEDETDAASRANNEAELVSLAEAGHQRLREIERALAKLDAGTYGVDEESGEPIGYPRLAAIPWARFAVSRQEQRQRR
jgi:DnaK suppressor protein